MLNESLKKLPCPEHLVHALAVVATAGDLMRGTGVAHILHRAA